MTCVLVEVRRQIYRWTSRYFALCSSRVVAVVVVEVVLVVVVVVLVVVVVVATARTVLTHPYYENNQQTHFSVFDVFYSQYSHQHVSTAIAASFRVMLLLQVYKGTDVVSCVTHIILTEIIIISNCYGISVTQLTPSASLCSCNNNITLTMVAIPVETCW